MGTNVKHDVQAAVFQLGQFEIKVSTPFFDGLCLPDGRFFDFENGASVKKLIRVITVKATRWWHKRLGW